MTFLCFFEFQEQFVHKRYRHPVIDIARFIYNDSKSSENLFLKNHGDDANKNN